MNVGKIFSGRGRVPLRYVLLTLLFVVCGASVASADGLQLPLTYTVMGTGGLSAPQSDVSNSKFWWVDSSGTVPASAVTATGFEPFPAFERVVDELGVGGGGSLLMSSSFTLGANEALNVNFDLLTRQPAWTAIGDGVSAPQAFALLLRDGQVSAVLVNIDAEGHLNFGSYLSDPPTSPYYITGSDRQFTPATPGVTTTLTPRGVNYLFQGQYTTTPDVDVTLGDTHYWHNVSVR